MSLTGDYRPRWAAQDAGARMNRQRAVCGAAVAAAGAAGLGWWLTETAAALLAAAHSPVPIAPEDAVTLLAACLGLLLLLWLAVGVLASVLALLPGRVGAAARRVADRVAPALTRRLAVVIVGASLGGALAPGTALARDGRIVPSTEAVTAAVSPSFAPEAPAAGGGPGWGAGGSQCGGPGTRVGAGPPAGASAALAAPRGDVPSTRRAPRGRGAARRHAVGPRAPAPRTRRDRCRGRPGVASVAPREPGGDRAGP